MLLLYPPEAEWVMMNGSALTHLKLRGYVDAEPC